MKLMVLHNIWAQHVATKLIQRSIPFKFWPHYSDWYYFEVSAEHSQDLNEIRVTVPADNIN